MRQKDIERMMAAAWELMEAPHSQTYEFKVKLRCVMVELDPRGVYRPGAPQSSLCPEADGPSLRDSPKL